MFAFSLIIAGVVIVAPFQRFKDFRECQTAGINLSMLLDADKGYEIECKHITADLRWMIAAVPVPPK